MAFSYGERDARNQRRWQSGCTHADMKRRALARGCKTLTSEQFPLSTPSRRNASSLSAKTWSVAFAPAGLAIVARRAKRNRCGNKGEVEAREELPLIGKRHRALTAADSNASIV